MHIKRVAGNAFLAIWLWVTLCALLLTVLRVRIFLPRGLVLYAYGMMAPYQSYGMGHEEMLAEGRLPEGSWEKIDLYKYFPVLFGEANVRQYFAMYNYSVDPAERGALRERFGRALLALERRAGRPYDAVRFSWERWPHMTGDFYLNKFPAISTSTPLIELNNE